MKLEKQELYKVFDNVLGHRQAVLGATQKKDLVWYPLWPQLLSALDGFHLSIETNET